MGCHGAQVGDRRYANEDQLRTLGKIQTGVDAAITVGTLGAAAAPSAIRGIGMAYQATRASVPTVELFGGAATRSAIRGAVNVDTATKTTLTSSVRGSVESLPFRTGSAQNVVASGPQAPFWSEASRVLAPGGRLVVNATKGNKFGRVPDAATLDRLGLRVERPYGPRLPEFANTTFKRTDGTVIPPDSVQSVVLRKVGGS